MASGPTSIASMTSTRLDSASKHQLAVRVDYEHMLSWVSYDALVMQKEKMKWCMNKDDLAIGCSRPIRNNEPRRTSARNKAYPSIVVTLGMMQDPAVHYLVALYHNSKTFAERDAFVQHVERNVDRWVGKAANQEVAKKQIQEMPEFYFVGVSVGLAYAHPNSGDNVATSMMGGMITIMNGAFEVRGGDSLQWYWDVEEPCFTENGLRRRERIKSSTGDMPMSSEDVTSFLAGNRATFGDGDERRRKFFERGQGTFGPPQANIQGKVRVAFPKPFIHQDEDESVYDRMRVFAKAVGSAKRFEKLDIMICRQSL